MSEFVQVNDGPEVIVPSDLIKTTLPNGRVKLRTDIENTIPPLSVPGLINHTVEKYPNHTALCYQDTETKQWKKITYQQYRDMIYTCAKAFLKLGLQRYHGVCILGFNSPEWFIADLAAIHAGGISAGIYTTNSPEACQYCCESSKANIVVAEDEQQVEKIVRVRDNLPHLKQIIQYSGTPKHPGVISWTQLMELGAGESDEALQKSLNTLCINECVTLVYTSGTVGNPKAVMLSHDNITFATRSYSAGVKFIEAKEVIISFLPLSHIAAKIIDMFISFHAAATVYFADRDALKGSLVNVLKEARPTHLLAVPRVWEKIYEKMSQTTSQAGPLKRFLFNWAQSTGLSHNLNRLAGGKPASWSYSIANKLVYQKVRAALGLDRCKAFYTAAAPLDESVKEFFLSIDIIILEVYGMSECTGGHTANFLDNYRRQSVGRTFKEIRCKIDRPDASGEGEICMGGRHVFMGYMNDQEKTDEAIDDEGWLHSGDIGKIDSAGSLYITGRIKELIITAGGENIPPVRIEQLLKNQVAQISNAVLIGDKRKYLTLLITLKTEMDEKTGAPKDTLTNEVREWLKTLGIQDDIVTVSQLIEKDPAELRTAIMNAINDVNKSAISNAQRVQKFAYLPADFSISTGELGPTLKLKRNVITSKYADIIERLYN